jgi:hypothetical protein
MTDRETAGAKWFREEKERRANLEAKAIAKGAEKSAAGPPSAAAASSPSRPRHRHRLLPRHRHRLPPRRRHQLPPLPSADRLRELMLPLPSQP